jgi:hypothetical protein
MPACTKCGVEIEGLMEAGGPAGRGPVAGDFVICYECGHGMAITDDGHGLRELTREEKKEVNIRKH